MKRQLQVNSVTGKNSLNRIKHYAVIPARRDSIGIPFKNRKFFEKKFKFVKSINFFSDIIVTTNDKFIINKCKKKKITYIKRPEKLSKSNISIKSVFIDLINRFNFTKKDFLWLFYIPLMYNSKSDIISVKKIIDKKFLKSVCGFVDIKTHPYNTWSIEKNKIKKLHDNDFFRRQDLPKLYEHHHHVCSFRVDTINKLNSELIGKFTYPILLNPKTQKKIIELDTYTDYRNYLSNEKKKTQFKKIR